MDRIFTVRLTVPGHYHDEEITVRAKTAEEAIQIILEYVDEHCDGEKATDARVME